jgi:hypothetical protein
MLSIRSEQPTGPQAHADEIGKVTLFYLHSHRTGLLSDNAGELALTGLF